MYTPRYILWLRTNVYIHIQKSQRTRSKERALRTRRKCFAQASVGSSRCSFCLAECNPRNISTLTHKHGCIYTFTLYVEAVGLDRKNSVVLRHQWRRIDQKSIVHAGLSPEIELPEAAEVAHIFSKSISMYK